MPLKMRDFVFCTLNAKLRLYEVTSIVKQGKAPRYELGDIKDHHKLILPLNKENDWLGNYIFLEEDDAKNDLHRRTQNKINKWSNEMFQGKEQLAKYLFQLWLDIDNLENFSDEGEQSEEIRNQKIKLFADKMEEYFNVKVVTPNISK